MTSPTLCRGGPDAYRLTSIKSMDLIDEILDRKETEEPAWPSNLLDSLEELVVPGARDLLSAIRPVLRSYPTDPNLLLLSAIAALLEGHPDQALSYIKRFQKRFVMKPAPATLQAIALSQKENWFQ